MGERTATPSTSPPYLLIPTISPTHPNMPSSGASTDKASKWAKLQNKELWPTLDGKDAALERLASRVGKRQGTHIADRVALTDGAEALQKRVLQHFPGFTLILDFIHANVGIRPIVSSRRKTPSVTLGGKAYTRSTLRSHQTSLCRFTWLGASSSHNQNPARTTEHDCQLL